jgi:proteasome lid subunit RPN8/RPN11
MMTIEVADVKLTTVIVRRKGGPYRLEPSKRFRLHRRAYRSQQATQGEVCGLLVQGKKRDLDLMFVENAARRPGRFEMGRASIASLRRSLRRTGVRVIGYFHSHPISPPTPGLSDARNTPRGALRLIYDVCGREAKLRYFLRRGDQIVAVDYPLSC